MHPEAYNFVKEFADGRHFSRVLEFGSLDINGSVRNLFSADDYWGIDLQNGPGVDEVVDAGDFHADLYTDCVVCCEVLEHAKDWRRIVENAYDELFVEGWFVVTCATHPRAPHSALDGGPLRPGEYYENIPRDEFTNVMTKCGFMLVDSDVDPVRGDLYALAQKP